MGDNLYKIKAELSHILYPKGKQSDESTSKIASFTITEIVSQQENRFIVGERYTIKGIMPKLSITDEYIIHVKYKGTDSKYGDQFDIEYINTAYDIKTNKDASKFLKRILSESQYYNVMKDIDNPLEIISEGQIDKLIAVNGIGQSTAEKIIKKFNTAKDYSEIYIELSDYGLTDSMLDKLIKKYKSSKNLIDTVKKDIYVLSDIDGYGFSTADKYFLKGGGLPTSPKRIYAYATHYLKEESLNGNSWVYSNVFAREIYSVFGADLDRKVFASVIKELEDADKIYYDRDNKRLGLMSIYRLEKAIAKEIRRLESGKTLKYRDDWEDIIQNIENAQGWKYVKTQKEGIKTILDNQLVLVTGLAGSGKTTLFKAITQIYGDRYSLIQCALSGCASQRMNQVSGLDANTIHKTLEFNPKTGFNRNASNPIDAEYLLIDEASMISGDIFLRLLQAIPTGTKVIITGDYGQLESIGVCNVFFDLLKSNISIVKLTETHRQAQASAITSKSKDMRNKKQLFEAGFKGREILGELQDLELNIDIRSKLQGYAIRQYLHYAKRDGVSNVMGVTPMRERGDLSCYSLNTRIQESLDLDRTISIARNLSKDKKYIFYKGDKIINTKNNYSTKSSIGHIVPIFNGNIGIVKEIYSDSMIVSFASVGDIVLEREDINKIELAYFITVHKSQGSECDTVIFAIDYTAYKMLTNELIYTGITRAKKYCILVAENNAVRKAITNLSTTVKQTYLAEFLN